MKIKVLIADDHEIIREGLASLFRGSDIKIVAEAKNGDEAVAMARKHHPQVVLLDVRMPKTDGLAALEKLRAEMPDMKVIMLSTHDNPTYVARAAALGACNYLLKGATRQQLIAAVTAAAKDELPTRFSATNRMSGVWAIRQCVGSDDVPLTNREMQTLRHLVEGLSNNQIGHSMSISIETVKEYVQNVLRKIAVNDRTQAAVWAVRNGLA